MSSEINSCQSFFFLNFANYFRCISLTEPALSKLKVQYIERLLSIYMNKDSTKSSEHQLNDKIYTLDDYNQKNQSNPPEMPEIVGNIWKETPGKSREIKFNIEKLLKPLNESFECLQMVLIGNHVQLEVSRELVGYKSFD